MRRTAFGVLAVLLLGIGLPLYLWSGVEGSSVTWIAAAIRIGAMFGTLWLAYPQLERIPPSLWIGIVVIVIVLARFRYLALAVVAVLIALAILKPRRQTR
jgi:hypothetical protein